MTKSPKIATWPGFLALARITRTKVVLARTLEKQGSRSTPADRSLLCLSAQSIVHLAAQIQNMETRVANFFLTMHMTLFWSNY